MKIRIILCSALICLLTSCANVESKKVGYAELAKSIQAGQKLQLVMTDKKLIHIKVESLTDDAIIGTSLRPPRKRLKVMLDDVKKIKVY